MKLSLFVGLFLVGTASLIAGEKPNPEDSITVKVVGTLRTGIVAIGGETSGTTITSKNITWELDFGKNAQLTKAAVKLNGEKVLVEGSLEKRKGVEIKERWIVTVTRLEAADGKIRMGGESLYPKNQPFTPPEALQIPSHRTPTAAHARQKPI